MKPTLAHEHGGPDLPFERIVFFSDAVFAIAITLLVLDIRVPGHGSIDSAAALAGALGDLIPSFFAFFLGFLMVGYYWVMHHTMFRHIRRWDGPLLVLNLAMLLCVAFVPFPVALFGAHRHLAPAVALYAATLTVTGVLQALVWRHATRGRRLTDPDLDPATVRLVYLRTLSMPVVMGLSIPLSFVSPTWSVLSWLLIAPVLRVIRGRIQRKAAAPPPPPTPA